MKAKHRSRPSFFQRIFNFLWSRFWFGFISLLPFVITFGLLYFTLEIINKWLSPFGYLQPTWLAQIPYSETVFAILFILFVGSVLKNVLMSSVLALVESIVIKMPMIKTIYTGVKQLLIALGPQLDEPKGFTQAVIIEFPRKGIYSIGFLTTQVIPSLSPGIEEPYFNVFIPTTPNPTTGYFVMMPESEIVKTDINRQEAMAIIISGGIIQPSKVHAKRKSGEANSKKQ